MMFLKEIKNLQKNEYYGRSILLIESTCEAENKYYPQTFLENFFEKHNSVPSLFKQIVKIVNCSDDESNN